MTDDRPHYKHRIVKCIAALPLGILYLVSDLAFVVVYHMLHYRAHVIRRNLLMAFPEKTDEERKHIEKAFYHCLCDLFIESFKTLNISDSEMRKRVEVVNCELPERIAAEGRNSFMLLGHCGCWEWCQEITKRYKQPKKGCELYKEIKSPYFSSLMYELRSHWSTTQVEMHQAVRTLLAWTKEGEPFLAGFISDQRPDGFSKHFLTFMNQDTGFQPGAEEIARKVGAELIYLDIERPRRGHYRLTFKEMNIDDLDDKDSPYPLTRLYFQMLEQTIRKQPEIWLWSHNRWNHPRNRRPEDNQENPPASP